MNGLNIIFVCLTNIVTALIMKKLCFRLFVCLVVCFEYNTIITSLRFGMISSVSLKVYMYDDDIMSTVEISIAPRH